MRDAELVLTAREISSRDEKSWIVLGDLNDVGWSRITRMFKDLSGMRDPRIGRGTYNTYPANWPLLRYPVDHVFLTPGMRLHDLRRVTCPGSDHFAILASVVLETSDDPRPDASENEEEAANEMVEEGHEDADENAD
jgi:endonuclease/exonuclease/phosphatase (EEP) superfamily protein YafD